MSAYNQNESGEPESWNTYIDLFLASFIFH